MRTTCWNADSWVKCMMETVSRRAGSMTDAVSVVLIDDHDVIHAGVRAWFAEQDPPIQLVAEYNHPKTFLTDYPEGGHDIEVPQRE